MVERHEQEADFSGPRYTLELREYGDHAEVAILRQPRDGDEAGVFADVWTNGFATVEAARTIRDVMRDRPERWAAWARMSEILGADFVAGLIEAEALSAAEQEATRIEKERKRAKKDREAEEESRRVWMQLFVDRPRIVGRRGNGKFLELEVDTAVEARRIWDWVRWQRPAFDDWYALYEQAGEVAVEKLVLESMLITEKKVKASGLSAGGRRPLRYWRPETAHHDDAGDGE